MIWFSACMLTLTIQLIALLSVATALPLDDATLETPIQSNTIHRFISKHVKQQHEGGGGGGGSSGSHGDTQQHQQRSLKKVFLSNRSVTCNDGSQAGFYLRKSHTSKKWIIFLEGGWYCYDRQSCQNRWLKQRHYMTSAQWPETRDVGGILSPSEDENPYWWNANHVFVPYCTSDSWSGSKAQRADGMFNFMGAAIVQQVVRDLVPLGLENSTDLLLAGSSAGGTGVMLNLDAVQELLHDMLDLRHIAVRGITDSGWFLDRAPYAPTGKPPADVITKGMQMWQGKVPRRCRQYYQHEPWRCYFGYRLYPTVRSPLFVFQWLFDEAQMNADNVGPPVSKQQWDYIHKMGDALRHSFENVSAVFAPSCISHSILTKKDWRAVQIDDVTIAEALHKWEMQPVRNVVRRMRNSSMYDDEPSLANRQVNKRLQNEQSGGGGGNKQRRRRRKHQRNMNKNQQRGGNKPKNKQRRNKGKRPHHRNGNRNNGGGNTTTQQTNVVRTRPQRSILRAQKHHDSAHRRLERCTWPQCNHSCPKLHNPFTGEEMDFIELLKSFGLDMESVAVALGIDMTTLNNMDHGELLNLLTQQAN